MFTTNRITNTNPLPAGFTLIEAVVALAITTMAASVMLLALQTSVSATLTSVDRTIAQGIAKQLIDEVFGNQYKEAGDDAWSLTLGPTAFETLGEGRERYDDIDDYNGYAFSGAVDLYGDALGTGDGNGIERPTELQLPASYFTDWRQSIEVYYVSDSDPSVRLGSGNTSNHRAVEVVISRVFNDGSSQELARIRRVIAYVP